MGLEKWENIPKIVSRGRAPLNVPINLTQPNEEQQDFFRNEKVNSKVCPKNKTYKKSQKNLEKNSRNWVGWQRSKHNKFAYYRALEIFYWS